LQEVPHDVPHLAAAPRARHRRRRRDRGGHRPDRATGTAIANSYQSHITYLPASRFWPVQGVESGIFLVLALALAMFTYWSVMTRDA